MTYNMKLRNNGISKIVYRHGYDLVTFRMTEGLCEGQECPMVAAFNWRGDYIGDARTARRLVEKRGILPQLRTPTSNVCSVGFSLKDRKWYGWSHRAIFGFKGRDAKRKAYRFAASVS